MASCIVMKGSNIEGKEGTKTTIIARNASTVVSMCADWICTRCDSIIDDSQVEILLDSNHLTFPKQTCSSEYCLKDTKKFCPAKGSIDIELTESRNTKIKY